MNRVLVAALGFVVMTLPGLAGADELTAIVQQDLVTLGYDPGGTDGEATIQTAIAVSKFQAEHELEVTGEITPQLAGIIKAQISQRGQAQPARAAPAAQAATLAEPAAGAQDAAALQAAQQACLQQKMADAQQAQSTRRGFGNLMRAVTRTATRMGGGSDLAQISSDIYTAGAVAADLEAAARDLGITETDIEACRNPQ